MKITDKMGWLAKMFSDKRIDVVRIAVPTKLSAMDMYADHVRMFLWSEYPRDIRPPMNFKGDVIEITREQFNDEVRIRKHEEIYAAIKQETKSRALKGKK